MDLCLCANDEFKLFISEISLVFGLLALLLLVFGVVLLSRKLLLQIIVFGLLNLVLFGSLVALILDDPALFFGIDAGVELIRELLLFVR